jgi:hypothetical protein
MKYTATEIIDTLRGEASNHRRDNARHTSAESVRRAEKLEAAADLLDRLLVENADASNDGGES